MGGSDRDSIWTSVDIELIWEAAGESFMSKGGGECRDQDDLGTPVTWNLNLPRALHLSLLLLSIYQLRIFSLLSPYDKETFIVSCLMASTSGERLVFSSPIQIRKILGSDSHGPVVGQWVAWEPLT